MAMQRGDEMVTRVCGYSLECTVHGGATSDKITVTRWSPGGDSVQGIPIRLNLVFCHPNADTRRWVADRQHTHVERGKNGVAPVVFTEALELSGVSCSTGKGERRRGIWAMMVLSRQRVSGYNGVVKGTFVVGKFAKGRQVGTAPDSMSDNNKQRWDHPQCAVPRLCGWTRWTMPTRCKNNPKDNVPL
ncbi:hypothetical protein Bbelb_338650 [Branchiostoma belcheri]|nr:hypothetical protein Bbelb_371750 [Branchiostoma belcheri]KAI8488269.1 hypothetical protein Bbelb_338650 [Branchiostoma belcheri]